jgi:hypothetical protein
MLHSQRDQAHAVERPPRLADDRRLVVHLSPMTQETSSTAGADSNSPRQRWLLLIQQLPTRPSSARIKLWRRLQQVGSVVLKNSVYVLPHTPQAREDFEWLATEIRAGKGHASILLAEALSTDQEEEIRDAFRQARSGEYDALRAKAREVLRTAPAHPTGTTRQALERALRSCRDELARIDAIDFCGASGRAAAADTVQALAARLTRTTMKTPTATAGRDTLQPRTFKKRVWVTRPHPGVDRMACAWLIRRFIDPAATFVFADTEAAKAPRGQIPFDMYGADFGHQGDRCSFETLCDRFGLTEPAVTRLAQIVHDVDLKDRRYGPPEAPMVASLIEGLRASYPNDHELLEHGIALFAGLYESGQASGETASAKKSTRRSPARAGKR